jgi:hypothetical protein
MTSSSPSPPTLKLTMGSTIPLTAKTLTKYLRLGFVEEMSTQMFAVRGCLNNAASLLTERCPQQKEAIGGYDECMLRYSNRSILGVMETNPSFYMWNTKNISAYYVNQFNQDLRTLLESLSPKKSSCRRWS